MTSNPDPLGYYAVLGVDPKASTDNIKKAFRAKAQELHPDRNPSAHATQQFQFLNEAHQVLGDPHSRSEYDASAYTLDEHADIAERGQTPAQPIACCVCGKISIQPRYAIYRYVTSFFLITYRGVHQGIFCARCGARRAYKNSVITWILGWWGIPWGPIYSIQAIARNMLGGEQPPLSNFRILAVQAAHFASSGSMDLARLIADQAFEFVAQMPAFGNNQESVADRDLRAALAAIQTAAPPPTRTLKSSWGTRSFAFRIQALAATLVSVTLLALLISSARTSRTAYKHPAPGTAFDQAHLAGGNAISARPDNPGQSQSSLGAVLHGAKPGYSGSQLGQSAAHRAADAPTEQQEITFNESIRALPKTGRMHILRTRARDVTAPLTIVSFTGSPNYYVKLVGWSTHAPVAYFFIRSGEALSGEVPLGRYEIHYAAGNTWYGEEYLFGPDTTYSKADAELVFEREGDKLAGYSIQLSKRLGGNLKEIPITPSEF